MGLLRLLQLRAGEGPGRESAAPSLAGGEGRRAGELRGKPGEGGWVAVDGGGCPGEWGCPRKRSRGAQ